MSESTKTCSSCFLCALPTQATLLTTPEDEEETDTPPLLKAQLETFFFVSSLLKIPFSDCVSLLSTYGDPAEWLSLCPFCQGRLREVYRLNQAIRELVRKLEEVKESLLRPLFLVKTEADEVITGDIHPDTDDGHKGSMLLEAEARIRNLAQKIHRNMSRPSGFLDAFDFDIDENDPMDFDLDRDDSFLIEPDFPLLGKVKKESLNRHGEDLDLPPQSIRLKPSSSALARNKGKRKRDVVKKKIAPIRRLKQPKKKKNFLQTEHFNVNSPLPQAESLTALEIQSMSGPQLLGKLFDGSFYTCPIPTCSSKRGFISKRRMCDHVRALHPPFLPHLLREEGFSLPPDHICHPSLCTPSLLMNPTEFAKKQRGLRKRNEELYGDNKKKQNKKGGHQEEDEEDSVSNFLNEEPRSSRPSRAAKELANISLVVDMRRDDEDEDDWRPDLDTFSSSGEETNVHDDEDEPLQNEKKRPYQKNKKSNVDGFWDFLENDSSEGTVNVEEIKGLSAPQILQSVFNEVHYTCPMSCCRSRRAFETPRSFISHLLKVHPLYRDHLRPILPPDHTCKYEDGGCLPSLLLKPCLLSLKASLLCVPEKFERPIVPSSEPLPSAEEMQTLSPKELRARLFTGSHYLCPFCPTKLYQTLTTWHFHLRKKHPKFQALVHVRTSATTTTKFVPTSRGGPLLSKEDILSLIANPKELRERLFVDPHYLCPFCPHRKYLHHSGWFCHLRRHHPKFLLHIRKKGVPKHECEEGNCIPRTTSAEEEDPEVPPPEEVDEWEVPEEEEEPLLVGQVKSFSSSQLFEALFNGSFYTCPIAGCRSRRGYDTPINFINHTKTFHPFFRDHLRPFLPLGHKCIKACLPMLLLRPRAFARKQGAVTPPGGKPLSSRPADWDKVLQIKEKLDDNSEPAQKKSRLQILKKSQGLLALSKKFKMSSFPCPKCPSTTFSSYSEYLQHQNQAHGQGYRCTICAKNIFTVQSVENHTRLVHGDKDCLSCTGCGVRFRGSDYFNTHLRKKDTSPACIENAVPCLRCPNFKLENSHTLEIHVRVKHETDYATPFKCEVCPAAFKTKKNLVAHVESHEGDGEVCPQCGKKFGSALHLRNHVRKMHGPPETHTCRVCRRTFPSKNGLARHMHLHRPGKPHVCHICGKGFKTRNYLTIHSFSHDPEKRKKYAEYNDRLKNNVNRVRRGRRERVEEVPGI